MTVLIFCTAGGYIAGAQEITMPERWNAAMYRIRPLFVQDTVTICILGDIMMHQAQIDNARRPDGGYDFSSYFHLLEDRIREADIAVANMEFTLAGEPYTGYPCFSAPDTLVEYLVGCGIDVLLAANNHIFDKGSKGAERTLEIYRRLQQEKGVRFTGLAGNEDEQKSNSPLISRARGISIAFINITYGTNIGLQSYWPKTNRISEKEKIAEAFDSAHRQGCEYIIALPHWGTEYRLRHSKEQEEYAEWLAEQGADCIIGSHPHVIQDADISGNVPVAYSLGNAVSNMSAPNTQLELMATIRLVRKENGDLEPLPIELEYLWCSRPGGYNDRYTVIPVAGFIGRKDRWQNSYDYDKMISTYERVRKETGIE